jgi:hypothetical protein
MPANRHQFQRQDSAQTLQEGLAEYFAAHPGLKRDEDLLAPEARDFFRSHDVVHVVYGCDTSMPDEAVVKIASLVGTTGGWRVLHGYTHHETLAIYTKLPIRSTLAALTAAPVLVGRTLWSCKQQGRRWPWSEYQPYMERPLAETRREFGIKVAHGAG